MGPSGTIVRPDFDHFFSGTVKLCQVKKVACVKVWHGLDKKQIHTQQLYTLKRIATLSHKSQPKRMCDLTTRPSAVPGCVEARQETWQKVHVSNQKVGCLAFFWVM